MEEIHLFLLEDDVHAMRKIEFLKKTGIRVTHARELISTSYYLEEKPGLDSFTHMMFDLDVPRETVEHKSGITVHYGVGERFAGLEYIKKNYELLRGKAKAGRVAILTGFCWEMTPDFANFNVTVDGETIDLSKEIQVIDKASDDMTMQVEFFLRL
jgi:hypothetical protein